MKGIARVRRARSQLVTGKHPFFGCLLLELQAVASTDHDTFAVDGKHLFVNEEFADTLTDAELRGVLVHEVLHLAYSHHTRQGKRDHNGWNEAADFAINAEVFAQGFELPKGALHDPQLAGLSAEEIYAKRRQAPKGGGGKAGGQGHGTQSKGPGASCGEILPAPKPGDEAGKGEERAKWEAKVFNAAAVAKAQGQGKLPAGIERLVAEQRKPARASWRELLRQFVDQRAEAKDWNWARPNRRFISQGLYLPGLQREPAGTILAAVDTSGSIDGVTLNAFRDELQGILDSGVCERLRVVYCDAALQGEAEFDSGDTIELKPKGFGGTAFGPVMEWADAQDEGVCLVYLTDLYGSHGKQPAVPVLWAAIDPRAPDAPFGERVNVDPFDK